MYQPNNGRGVAVADTPVPLPSKGSDAIYSYENLPADHWKKYLYAYRYSLTFSASICKEILLTSSNLGL